MLQFFSDLVTNLLASERRGLWLPLYGKAMGAMGRMVNSLGEADGMVACVVLVVYAQP